NQIYRVTRSFHSDKGVVSLHLSSVAPPFGPLLVNDFPDIKKMTRLLNLGTTAMKYEDKNFNEVNVFAADENFFSFFSVDVLKGDSKSALTDPASVMLSEDVAKKYFGSQDPINKIVRLYNQFNLKVTGVYKSFPINSHIHPRLLVSFNSLKNPDIYGEENLRSNWGNNAFPTYIMLPDKYPVASLEKKLPAFINKYLTKEYNNPKPSNFTTLSLQKLTDIHLRSHLDDEAEANGDIKRVYIFSAIALFILLIACINYMNLATARSVLRAKEIGIRKVSGARKGELMLQFLTESVMITLFALTIAVVLTWACFPLMNKLTGLEMQLNSLLKWNILVPVLIVPILVGICAGLYPALFMSSFQPVKTLKGFLKIGGGSVSFRKVLVVTQFSISIVLIISTAVVFQQLNYIQKANLGYQKEHVISMNIDPALNNSYESFRQQLLQLPGIEAVGRSSRSPTGRLLDSQGAGTVEGDSTAPTASDIKYVMADHQFIPTYKIKMIAGRNFSKDFGTDSSSYILNETAARNMGWRNPAEAVGKTMSYGGKRGPVIGVMHDFHFESMHQKIVPLLLCTANDRPGLYGDLSIRISGKNIGQTLAYLEKTYKKFVPETPFQFNFLDERFQMLYDSETRQGSIFAVFSGIAIFIACLGLFGLSAFAITQRMKEIGVRKVLGASVSSIVQLLSKDFLKLVGVAALIAFPVAWYAMYNWLEDFAYRVTIAWWIFLLAGIIAALIAVVTISLQAIKAALANPVKSLRSE
ncbi:MAG TPA: FtsX-like permease family protein, partial [Flavitalea sp.]|nr:FtsX-like permease family protein [Flavitalea sp.]